MEVQGENRKYVKIDTTLAPAKKTHCYISKKKHCADPSISLFVHAAPAKPQYKNWRDDWDGQHGPPPPAALKPPVSVTLKCIHFHYKK